MNPKEAHPHLTMIYRIWKPTFSKLDAVDKVNNKKNSCAITERVTVDYNWFHPENYLRVSQ